MKFRCERDVLVEAVIAAGRAASPKAQLRVLSGLRFDLHGDRLRVTGSDLELTVTIDLEVAGSDDGVAVLPAKLVTDIIRNLEPGAVEVDTAPDRSRISGGRSEFTLNSIPHDQFPTPSELEGERVTVAGAQFADGLRQVVGAASTDESRKVLTGVLLAAEPDGLRMVSTDSYRLAFREFPGTTVLAEGQRVNVPSRALQELARSLESDDEVEVVLAENQVSFRVGGFHLSSWLIKDDFPDYDKLIPGEMPNELRADRQVLQDAIRRVRLMAKNNSPIHLSMTENGLMLTARNAEDGEATEEVDASYSGESLVVAFNPEYLMDGLEVVGSDEVVLQTRDPQKPAVLRPVDSQDFLYLLMPVRVS